MPLKKTFDWLLKKLYPPRCIFCGEVLEDGVKILVCKSCAVNAEKVSSVRCPVCGSVTELGTAVCWNCSVNKIPFESHRSVYYYCGGARRAVIRLKFRNKPHYAKTMGLLMSVYAPKPGNIDFVTFVPMTSRAVKKRGYNQSRLLAESIAENTGLECLQCLTKQRETNVQSTLKFTQRQKNISGAFKVSEDVRGKKLVLVDDVYTTGATIRECAKVLKKAGAAEINCITFAMTKGKYDEDK